MLLSSFKIPTPSKLSSTLKRIQQQDKNPVWFKIISITNLPCDITPRGGLLLLKQLHGCGGEIPCSNLGAFISTSLCKGGVLKGFQVKIFPSSVSIKKIKSMLR